MPNVPQKVLDLVEIFERNADEYRSGDFNEANLRIQFVNPLFKTLGWDMDNEQGYAEAYKDVIHEASVKVGEETKAPDYCFRISQTPKFFVEAKKPAVHIKTDPKPAFQLRRYGWSRKLPLSILTNFAGFAVYDCRFKPALHDKAGDARILYVPYTDYATQWDQIAGVFAREAILKGSFDKYAESNKAKRGTTPVDAAFLKEIEEWRFELAKNLALRNRNLTPRQLNYAVQTTIDRIIFLRLCEDRGIEPYGRLQQLLDHPEIYEELCKLFHKADQRYNSGLFHFENEKDRPEAPDELTTTLKIDDKILKTIIKSIYYPSPYVFKEIPADILGKVYEQFLGKVIRLTTGHNAKIEEKPEVKKAGGVYYTPTYIVDYIVKHTVGKLLGDVALSLRERNAAPASDAIPQPDDAIPQPDDAILSRSERATLTPKQAHKLRILDPACGSGSFLLGAYKYLLDWHRDWYVADGPDKHRKELFQGPGGGWKLTSAERKRILLNNIHGVDIDPQAVEVTKLSLLLKVLEGESHDTLESQRLLWHERALPDLASNIKCGNSLIGPDFYESRQPTLFDDEERYRINVFDWHAAFPQIMKAGGFDAVIGNPPYIRIQTIQETSPEQPSYLKKQFKAASSGNYDIYVVFVERGLDLLNRLGCLGFILPSKFFATDYGEGLRLLISKRKALSEVVDFGHAQVFEDATTYTCLLFLSNIPTTFISYSKVISPPSLAFNSVPSIGIDREGLTGNPWMFSTDFEKGLADKLTRNSIPLGDLPTRIGRGSSSGADDVFMLEQKDERLFTRQGEEVEIETAILRVPIYATDFGRYLFKPNSEEVILFPYNVARDRYELKSESEIRRDFPRAHRYLAARRKKLDARKQFKTWYGFSAPRNLEVHDKAQMLVPLLADRGLYCRLPAQPSRYCLMASGGFSITVNPEIGLSPNYVLGLLNSRLLFWRLRSISNIFRGGWITCTKQYVETLPIHLIDFSDGTDKARHDRLVQLVEQMLALHQQLASAKAPHDQTVLQGQIAATDREIDRLVYELYGLTAEEIRIVEEGTS